MDGVVFTGSVAGGRAVQRAARERFIDVALELGGKDPAYVAEDADLAFAAPNVVEGACYNAGQSCCAVERVYVHASRYEEFLRLAEEAVAGLGRPAIPSQEDTTLGPMARKSSLETLSRPTSRARSRPGPAWCAAGPASRSASSHPRFWPTAPRTASPCERRASAP